MSYLTNSLGATVKGTEKQGAGRIPTEYQDGGIASLQMGSFWQSQTCITLPDELRLPYINICS